jgi:hypothetical protein
MPKIVDVLGKKFGLLTVVSSAGLTNCGHKQYNCKCNCGNDVVRTGTSIRRSENSSCGCFKKIGNQNACWKGFGEISRDFWFGHIVRSANGSKNGNHIRKPKELSITIEDAWKLFLKQNRKCALTGLLLIFPTSGADKDWTASLDRIDSSKGYIKGNVQWVHKIVNIMKNKFQQDTFIYFCKKIAENQCEINL